MLGATGVLLRWAPALLEYIRLGWQLLTVTNTLAYYDISLITTVKSFIVQTPGPDHLYISLFQSSELGKMT